MAGAGWRDFVPGEVLTAANVQDYLQDQACMVFASSAARTSALASPTEGMISYLSDSNIVQMYTGSLWVTIADDGGLPIANGGTGATDLNTAQNNLRQGLVNMIPTTVTATSPGTATTTALGQVNYSGGVGVAVNGVFTSNYDNYVIKIQNLQGTLGADLGLRFRYGSTNNENTSYTYAGKGRSSAGTDTNIAQANGTYAVLGDLASTIAAMSATVNVYTPYVSQATSFQSIATNYTDSVGQVTIAGWDSQSAQNDGFYLFALTGNLNVKFTVYGYND